jgi:predicted nucleic acid-binding protein
MILLDTSVVIASFSGSRLMLDELKKRFENGDRVGLPALCLYEWLRGPRQPDEIYIQEQLFPAQHALPYGPETAELSARIYRTLSRARSREMDIAIAACAIQHQARLWTLNRKDYSDIPGLQLV